MTIELNPKSIFTTLLKIIAFLLLANVLGLISKFGFNHSHVFGLVPLFDFSTEKNIPTYYSAFMILVCSLLLLAIAVKRIKPGLDHFYWFGLSAVFLYLAFDEALSFHEMLVLPVREALQVSGPFHFAWVIPYGIAVILIAVLYARFLLSLPKKTATLFILAGAIFVTGALGFDLLEGINASGAGNKILFAFYYTVEELLEKLGIALFAYALLAYITDQFGYLTIRLQEKDSVTS